MSTGLPSPDSLSPSLSLPTSTRAEAEISPSSLTDEERRLAARLVWRAPSELAEPPGPDKILPQLEAPGIRIECVSRRPVDTLANRVETCRERQRTEGRMLASTFCHGGSLFLVFKHWPYSASPFPRST